MSRMFNVEFEVTTHHSFEFMASDKDEAIAMKADIKRILTGELEEISFCQEIDEITDDYSSVDEIIEDSFEELE